jgi:hypothetical protein
VETVVVVFLVDTVFRDTTDREPVRCFLAVTAGGGAEFFAAAATAATCFFTGLVLRDLLGSLLFATCCGLGLFSFGAGLAAGATWVFFLTVGIFVATFAFFTGLRAEGDAVLVFFCGTEGGVSCASIVDWNKKTILQMIMKVSEKYRCIVRVGS